MEGLILEVRADTGQFETAMSRLEGTVESSLAALRGTLGGLQNTVSAAAAGFEGLGGMIQGQDQSWIASGAALTAYRVGLNQAQAAMTRLSRTVAGATTQVRGLNAALAALPRQVSIDVVVNTIGHVPTFHQGGLVAGPQIGSYLGTASLVKAHTGAYFPPPRPEERDVRVLTGEYVLSRAGVRTLGLAALKAADSGRLPGGTAGQAQAVRVENHYHFGSLVQVEGSLVADQASLTEFAERISREIDWQTRGRTA
ncbi:MAG: hypothetical protein JRJ59_08920 [Deltaproteobacteria bacterium]|nr:hypothetical protein [Deltaproteobacteria bacterium]